MVHTIEVFINLSNEDLEYIQSKFTLKHRMNQDDLYLSSDGLTVTIVKGFEILKSACNYSSFTQWRAYVKVDLIETLNRPDINENDLPKVISMLKEYISHFCISEDVKMTLHRIDYRFDTVVEDERIRNILLKNLKKSYSKKYAMIQIKKVKGKPIPSSAYFYSKSKKLIPIINLKKEKPKA